MKYSLDYLKCVSAFGMHSELFDPETGKKFAEIEYHPQRLTSIYGVSAKGFYQVHVKGRLMPTYFSLEAAQYRALAEFIEWKETQPPSKGDVIRKHAKDNDIPLVDIPMNREVDAADLKGNPYLVNRVFGEPGVGKTGSIEDGKE